MAAAPLIRRTKKFAQITPVLLDLHWLPVARETLPIQNIIFYLQISQKRCSELHIWLSKLVPTKSSSEVCQHNINNSKEI